MSDSQYLQHYGVKGMKWGKRKAVTTETLKKYLKSAERQSDAFFLQATAAHKKAQQYLDMLGKAKTPADKAKYQSLFNEHANIEKELNKKSSEMLKKVNELTAQIDKIENYKKTDSSPKIKVKTPEEVFSGLLLKHSANGSQYLAHYGIPKMRWGIRRFQNEDGSLTEEGKIRYGKKSKKTSEPPTPSREYTNEELVRSGDPNLVLANANRLSTQELQAARLRMQELSSIRNMTMGEIRKKKEPLIKRGAKLIGKAIADQAADSTVKVAKGVTSYAIKKTVKNVLPDNWEWKGVIVSALNSSNKDKNQNNQEDKNQNNQEEKKKDKKEDNK